MKKSKNKSWYLLRRLGTATTIGAISAFGLMGVGMPEATASSNPAAGAPHVMTIMMENTDYSQFVGSPTMPYLNELSHQYANFTQAYGWTYPSLPNYLELLSGSDQGTAGNDCDINQTGCNSFAGPTLVDQLETAGLSWNAYYQGDASGCDQSDGGGNYPYWHNAFRYFADFSTQCSHISNFSDLNTNLDSANAADFQWVVPDLVNSGGDNGTMASGDSWLNGELPQIMNSSWYREGGQIVIVFDSGYNDRSANVGFEGGQIPMVVVSARTKGMGSISTPVDTAGVLHSIEHVYGLPYLADAANPAYGNLGDALVSSRPVGSPAQQISYGALLDTPVNGPNNVTNVDGLSGQTLALNGIAQLPSSTQKGSTPTFGSFNQPGSTIQVGENSSGQGVVVSNGNRVVSVQGTSALESVSCTTSTQCYAVGLGPSNADEGVLVSIRNGQATTTTPLPLFIGLYGIACPTTTTCYAVGYDNNDDADAVTTITNGQASAPAEVEAGSGVGEWLNSISCATATKCDAVGLVNYNPSFVPIANGIPGTPVTITDNGNAWYVNGIDCTTANNCAAVGENDTEQGIVSTLVNGQLGTTQVVSGTEYLYGVGCIANGDCVLTGASTPGTSGYSVGTDTQYDNGVAKSTRSVPGTNGFGQVLCGAELQGCVAVGAAYRN